MSRTANGFQILLVFFVAFSIVVLGWRLVGADPFARQAVVWVANLGMLVTIRLGLRVRGQTWEHLGLAVRGGGARVMVRAFLQSIAVLVAALMAFVAGSMMPVGAAVAGQADMSGYEYLHGNLPMLLVALAAVYVVSSFGEEVVYRGFLMTRLAEMGKNTRLAWSAAAVTSAIVFGLAHFDWGVVGMVQTAFMGLALAASYLVVGRNLWVLVLAHAYIDTVLLVQIYMGTMAAGTE